MDWAGSLPALHFGASWGVRRTVRCAAKRDAGMGDGMIRAATTAFQAVANRRDCLFFMRTVSARYPGRICSAKENR